MVYWIVSVPYEDSRTKSFKRLKKQLTQDQKLCDCNEFKIPKLRVGTLDQLVGLSDDLIKYDSQVEGATMKILRQLGEVSGAKEEDFVPEIIMQEDNSAPVELYLNFFQWDENQYLTTKPLRELTEVITKKVHKYDEELRVKATEYSVLKSNIQALERKRQGGLTVRLLDGVIKKEQVVESEYLTTLFVAVPKNNQKEWEKNYDKMDNIEFIVPDSSELIVDESDYCLYSVVLIRKKVDDFKTACQKRKYVVRDFEYDDEKFKLSLLEKDKMLEKQESERKELYEWCKVAFSECFSAWIHLKAIRTYVESVLRYGLPVRFVSLLLKVTKNEKKIHKFFRDNYSHLQEDEPAVSNEEMQIAAAQYGDFYPYVLLTINTNYPYLSTKL